LPVPEALLECNRHSVKIFLINETQDVKAPAHKKSCMCHPQKFNPCQARWCCDYEEGTMFFERYGEMRMMMMKKIGGGLMLVPKMVVIIYVYLLKITRLRINRIDYIFPAVQF
jgi:hypothetical protein